MQGVGIEPTRISPDDLKSSTLTTRSSLRLRTLGIEPRANPWKGSMLPLHHVRFLYYAISFK